MPIKVYIIIQLQLLDSLILIFQIFNFPLKVLDQGGSSKDRDKGYSTI